MAITEIGPDLYRISTYVPEIDLQFNKFAVKDDQPLLFHTGMKAMFPSVRDEVARVIDPSSIRWIGFEAYECGSLNEWLQARSAAILVGSTVRRDMVQPVIFPWNCGSGLLVPGQAPPIPKTFDFLSMEKYRLPVPF